MTDEERMQPAVAVWRVSFKCPGCGHTHALNGEKDKVVAHATWLMGFNVLPILLEDDVKATEAFLDLQEDAMHDPTLIARLTGHFGRM